MVASDILPEQSGGSSISKGMDRDVRPWLNLADDLRNLKLDQDISIPQVGAWRALACLSVTEQMSPESLVLRPVRGGGGGADSGDGRPEQRQELGAGGP